MCGRYTIRNPQIVFDEFSITGEQPKLEPRFNVAPTQLVPVVRTLAPGAPRRLDLVRWGLRPRRSGPPVIMVRLDSLERGAFGSSFDGRRCILAADGFYEWEELGPKRKMAHHVRRTDNGVLAIAGIWVPAHDGAPESCALITRPAVAPIADIHDRMPATLAHADYERWLDPGFFDPAELARMLLHEDGLELTMYPVGPRVNSPAHDDPACLDPPA